MSTELQVPFALTPSGGVAVITDPDTQAQQHVTALISTRPGERVVLAQYGVDLLGSVFSPDPQAVAESLSNQVTSAMATWEPTITVDSVTPAENNDMSIAQVNVEYSVAGSAPASGVNVATVLVGGSVIKS